MLLTEDQVKMGIYSRSQNTSCFFSSTPETREVALTKNSFIVFREMIKDKNMNDLKMDFFPSNNAILVSRLSIDIPSYCCALQNNRASCRNEMSHKQHVTWGM